MRTFFAGATLSCRAKDTPLPLGSLIFEFINYSLCFSELVIWFESAHRAVTPPPLLSVERQHLNAENRTEAWKLQEGIFFSWPRLVCFSWIWSGRWVNIDVKALPLKVHYVFCWIPSKHRRSSLAIQRAACVTVAGSYYAQITFPSLYNPSGHKGKLFMICNYVS